MNQKRIYARTEQEAKDHLGNEAETEQTEATCTCGHSKAYRTADHETIVIICEACWRQAAHHQRA